jgi:hypothetical protein
MTTPIEVLKQFIFPTLLRVAPEKSERLGDIIDSLGVQFIFVPGVERKFFGATPNKQILVGENCLQRLWAFSYAGCLFYEEMCRCNKYNESLDPKGERLKVATELLEWATSVDWHVAAEGKDRIDPVEPWPAYLPKPIKDAPKGSSEDIADKLFLHAVGFILHHELAHLRLQHSPRERVASILQEKDADRDAAKWLLEGIAEDKPEFFIRGCGIATALLWLASMNAYIKYDLDQADHPPAYDRLFQTLSAFIEDDFHPVWGFTVIMLELYVAATNPRFDESLRHASPKAQVNYFCDLLSRQFK